jgi:hypothetical protein
VKQHDKASLNVFLNFVQIDDLTPELIIRFPVLSDPFRLPGIKMAPFFLTRPSRYKNGTFLLN